MKYKLFFLSIFFFLLSFQSSSEKTQNPPKTSFGMTHFGNETLASIRSDGFLHLNGTHIIDTVHINGHLEAENAEIGNLVANGCAHLKNSIIKGTAIIHGTIDAHNTIFQNELSLTAEKASFSGCTLESIDVKKKALSFSSQTLEFHDHSKVKGSITFESKKGEVLLFNGSEVLGSVYGGTILHK
ncbi:MAG: hypothetical protein WCP39_02735 [Chlamydiota bacterium]